MTDIPSGHHPVFFVWSLSLPVYGGRLLMGRVVKTFGLVREG